MRLMQQPCEVMLMFCTTKLALFLGISMPNSKPAFKCHSVEYLPFLLNIGANNCEPNFGEYLHKDNKKDVSKPSNTLQYWTFCPHDLIEHNFSSLV